MCVKETDVLAFQCSFQVFAPVNKIQCFNLLFFKLKNDSKQG